ncbi:Foldase protein PrsA 1 [Porphyridium purpureum]|uniref:Foldase protein PrsA 1 n=1 Tax=Porphyridium purpureum TaxID=35688 RepID=A0A5J4YMQ9_PORPP|nr:Foldase protein PrsA 1 [Porphyridium purpureum]|eukprot:POR2804..scf295_9
MGNALTRLATRAVPRRVPVVAPADAHVPSTNAANLKLDETQWLRAGDAGARRLGQQLTEAQQVKARHVLVKDEQTAKLVVQELNAGEPFNRVAEKYSECEVSARRGGDLGWLRRDHAVREFQDAVFVVPKGLKDVVHTRFGIHVFEVTDRVEQGSTAGDESGQKNEQEDQTVTAEYRQTLNVIAGAIQSKKWGSDEPYSPVVRGEPAREEQDQAQKYTHASMRSIRTREHLPRERAIPQTSIPAEKPGVLNQLQIQKLLFLYWDDASYWNSHRLAEEFHLDEETVSLLLRYNFAFKMAPDNDGRIRAFSNEGKFSFRQVLDRIGEAAEHDQWLKARKIPTANPHEDLRQVSGEIGVLNFDITDFRAPDNVRAGHHGIFQIGTAQVCQLEVRVIHYRTFKVGKGKIGVKEGRARQVRSGEVDIAQDALLE